MNDTFIEMQEEFRRDKINEEREEFYHQYLMRTDIDYFNNKAGAEEIQELLSKYKAKCEEFEQDYDYMLEMLLEEV